MTPPSEAPTARQKEFLQALIRLWQADQEPVHYSRLAESMGVSRFSAYDMLRVLEAQGLAQASYALEHAGASTGRSSVYFTPSPIGLGLGNAGDAPPAAEWRTFRARLLGQLEASQPQDDDALMDDLLEQIPQRRSPIFYGSEVIAALLLNLNQARQKISAFNPLETLKGLTGGAGESYFALLAGLSLGAAMHTYGEKAQERSRQLLDYTRRFQEQLREVSEEGKRLLSDFLQDAMETIMNATHELQASGKEEQDNRER